MNEGVRVFSWRPKRGMAGSDAMALYRPKENFSERVTTFLTPAQKRRFVRLLEVWSAMDRRDSPDGKDWSEAEGARRLIEASLDGAWAEIGNEPKTDDDLARLVESIAPASSKKQKR